MLSLSNFMSRFGACVLAVTAGLPLFGQFSTPQIAGGRNLPLTLEPGYSVVEAVNMGGPEQVRGDITFAASTFETEVASSTVGQTTLEAFDSTAFDSPGTIEQDNFNAGDDLMFSELYSAENNIQLTFAGLSAASSYRLIILHGESRAGFSGSFTADTFFSGETSVVVDAYSFSDGSSEITAADFAAISVDFTGFTTVTYRMPGEGFRGASISGYVLEVVAIPEASAYASVFGLCALAAGLIQRRRRGV
jgi:hypothetical protein